MTLEALRARRETLVREHMADEIDHAWNKVLATFPPPPLRDHRHRRGP